MGGELLDWLTLQQQVLAQHNLQERDLTMLYDFPFVPGCVLQQDNPTERSVFSGKSCLLGRYSGNGAGGRCGWGSAVGEILCAPVPKAKGGAGDVAADRCFCSSGQVWVCAPGSGPQKLGFWDALYSVLWFPPCSLLVQPQLGLFRYHSLWYIHPSPLWDGWWETFLIGKHFEKYTTSIGLLPKFLHHSSEKFKSSAGTWRPLWKIQVLSDLPKAVQVVLCQWNESTIALN